MKKILITLIAVSALTCLNANTVSNNPTTSQETLNFQIIKEQINLNKYSFKSVKLNTQADGNYVVQVELTPDAAKQLNQLVSSNLNQVVNIVFQNKIISSPTVQSSLGANFEMTGFSRQQALDFIKQMQS